MVCRLTLLCLTYVLTNCKLAVMPISTIVASNVTDFFAVINDLTVVVFNLTVLCLKIGTLLKG